MFFIIVFFIKSTDFIADEMIFISFSSPREKNNFIKIITYTIHGTFKSNRIWILCGVHTAPDIGISFLRACFRMRLIISRQPVRGYMIDYNNGRHVIGVGKIIN